jgi:hypothetical protein
MKIISLSKIMKKLNKINYFMKSLIENKDNSCDYNSDFFVDDRLIYNGKLIIIFNKINSNFDYSNIGLISLEGFKKLKKILFIIID